MSNQAKLTLRPPPNVEFVQGYPGIPPGPDRPQAAVKGAIELRVGPQGIRAKWVRIELRKVETLPGGGQQNTFVDFVGQSPVNVWQTSDEYGVLHTQDFPFYIRIPDTVPPSLALEKSAGVKYELVATVCVKGKKGLLRRDKSSVLSTTANIILDKHELHSVWPLYQQPETRKLPQDSLVLIVERNQTCYGPGDRVTVAATLKSESLHTVILRGFEFTLKETTVFRAGPHVTGKKGEPQVRVAVVGDQKVPVNATLYGGQQHKAELNCVIPGAHTSATVSSARHIDITYILVVRALMGTGKPLVLDLPVVVSNWPRTVSVEAIKRIGPTQALCFMPNSPSSPTAGSSAYNQEPQTVSGRMQGGNSMDYDPVGQYATAPARQNQYLPSVDEFGSRGVQQADERDNYGYGTSRPPPTSNNVVGGRPTSSDGTSRISGYYESTASSSVGQPYAHVRSSTNPQPNMLTVANVPERDMMSSSDSIGGHGQGYASATQVTSPAPQQRQWLSAEEEKKRLYDSAVANVERVQGGSSTNRGSSPPLVHIAPSRQQTSPMSAHVDAGPINPHMDAGMLMQSPGVAPRSGWQAAEAEKERLYSQAQAAAARTQGYADGNGSDDYAQSPPPSASRLASGSSSQPIRAPQPQYPSAEQEKMMLRRYEEAKAAVDRGASGSEPAAGGSSAVPAPIAYDDLFPQPQPQPVVSPAPQVLSAHDEKERARRYYEAQDAVNRAHQQGYSNGYGSPPPSSPPPPVSPPAASAVNGNGALSEKEILRRKFEADDAAAMGNGLSTPPPSAPPVVSAPPGYRSRGRPSNSPRGPLPSFDGSAEASRLPTAEEEKARLKAMYEGQADPAQAPAYDASNGMTFGQPPPPPLMPRPPREYIQETQEEDRRSQGHSISDEPMYHSFAAPPLPPKVSGHS